MFYRKWISEKKGKKKNINNLFEKFYYTEFHTLSLSYCNIFLVDLRW